MISDVLFFFTLSRKRSSSATREPEIALNLEDLGSGEPAEQFVDGGPASEGVEEVAGDQFEVVLGREHLQEHDPAASYVLNAALHGCGIN